MLTPGFLKRLPDTPAYVFDVEQIRRNAQSVQALRAAGAKVLYSIKALPLGAVLRELLPRVDGFSVSSLFEARLARQISADCAVHLTSPGLKPQDLDELNRLCSHISFNSWGQFQRADELPEKNYSAGLRINPDCSFSADPRYDPCRPHSKLGAPLAECLSPLPPVLEGLQVHNVFSQTSLDALSATAAALEPILQANPHLKWLNLGGGYLYPAIADLTRLLNLIRRLRGQYGLEIYLEPGKALVGDAGYLVASVLDRFNSGGKTVIVLDTSVNHHPEVFEYQTSPPLIQAAAGGETALVAGGSCLAGDLFGEYGFNELPQIGDRLCFYNCGAYSLIKANRFNGHALPSVYMYSANEDCLRLVWRDGFEGYYEQWGGQRLFKFKH